METNCIGLIVAAGSGTRMGSAVPKQLQELDGIPLAIHSGIQFRRIQPGMELAYVVSKGTESVWQPLLDQYFPEGNVRCVEGGKTRYESVKNGIASLKGTEGLVAIHDAARPFIRPKMLIRAFESALEHGNAVLAVPVKDSLRQLTPSGSMAVKRDDFFAVQTPQIFKLKDLKPVYQQVENPLFTDDATVMELAGYPIHLVEGSYHNIKITTPDDWFIAERILQHLNQTETAVKGVS
ncbi:MAG TPA: IspD/TarI family cytidylyltransferase [Catalimonadaceae bacterium]|nr:IspD/TarI family cytidylyltransferase [Catalimonadaceae bacterium]